MGVFFILLLTAVSFGQEPPLFRAGVTLVKVDVQVMEGLHPVADLHRDDFLVFDEGAPQQITHFGRESEPLWVLLLLDISGSMGRFVKQLSQAAHDALATLNAGDHVGIMLFSRESIVHAPFTEDFDSVTREIGTAVKYRGLGTATRINTAVIDGAGYIRENLSEKEGRRAIVILTDNGGMNYKVPNEAVLRALSDADTVLNAIAIGDAEPPRPPRKGQTINPDFTPADVFLLARETGGEVVRSKKAGEAFRDLIERVRTRYSLHYHSPGGEPGSFRAIRVELSDSARKTHRKAEVKARSGYYVP